MGSRTYAPTLLFLLRKVCKYLALHRQRIIDAFNLNDNGAAALDAVVIACEAVFTLLGDAIIHGD